MLVLQSLAFGSFIGLVAFYANFRWNRRRLYELADKIPGPKGLPFIGIAHKLITVNSKVMFQTLAEVTEEFTSIAKAWIGPELLILADSPEALKTVLNSPHCLDKSTFYDMLLLTKSLIIAKSEMWKNHRKILNPAFSAGAVQRLIPTFEERTKIFVKNLKAEVDKKPFDVTHYMAACSLETILNGTMEYEIDVQSDPHNNRYLQIVDKSSRVFMKKVACIFYQFKPFYWLSDVYRFEKNELSIFFNLADKILDSNRLKRSTNKLIGQEKENLLGDLSFVNRVADPKNGLAYDEKWHEINAIIGAAYETSALAVSHTLLLLALHPEVQEKVVKEIVDLFGVDEPTISTDQLNKLVYLDYVVKETMRLFPVLPFSGRHATSEFQLGDYTVPIGATIFISTYLTHRNPKYWGEDAHQFRPERFEPENFKKIHPYAFIPFSGGPRICIGMRYGMVFVKTVLINVLREFKLSSELKYEELEYEISVSMKVIQKCMISLKNRNLSDG